jgi:hypothetical protein
MDATRAHRLISTLADGIHPNTGERLAPDSPYQQAEIVRALYCALRALEGQSAASPSKESLAPQAPTSEKQMTAAGPAAKGNAGKPWTADEERELLASFDAGVLPGEIAKQHRRSIAGIEARLEKLGRLRPDQRTTTSRYPLSMQSRANSTAS